MRGVLSVILALLVVSFENCAPFESTRFAESLSQQSSDSESESTNEPNQPSQSVTSLEAFEMSLRPIIQSNCASCHGVNQSPLFAVSNIEMSHDLLVQGGWVDFGNAMSSEIVTKISAGHHGNQPPLDSQIAVEINNWMNAISGM